LKQRLVQKNLAKYLPERKILVAKNQKILVKYLPERKIFEANTCSEKFG
jgi:hypothetical protein